MLGQEVDGLAGGDALAALAAGRQQFGAAAGERAPSSLATKSSASGVRISSKRGCMEPLILGSFGGSNMACFLADAASVMPVSAVLRVVGAWRRGASGCVVTV